LLHLLLKFVPVPPPQKERPPILCPCCGAVMIIVKTRVRPVLQWPTPGPAAAHGGVSVM